MTPPAPLGVALGARREGDRTRFAAYTTTARSCAVRFYADNGAALATHPMAPLGGGGFALETGAAPHGTLYRFVLDDRELPDPYARFLPRGVHGPAMVWEPRHEFRHPCVSRPLAEQVIYELHVGAFTPEGTYAAAIPRLDALRELGVTTIELMPVAAFAGERGWGYDGVALFAPHAPYGTPDDLRRFVDEAHARGLAVMLDVVYNHFGPAGNYLSAYSPAYFRHGVRNPWGDAPDFAHPAMRALAIDNARYWLAEFRFDGLRLDATHAIDDPSPRHVLAELADAARALEPRRVVIAEDDRNLPEMVRALGMDAVWADDFHHAVHVTLTGERDGYYAGFEGGAAEIARTIAQGWLYEGGWYPPTRRRRGRPAADLPAPAFLYCLQNHDQVGNRALGERLSSLAPRDACAVAAMTLLFLPMTPLLFMGQEWAASTPFLYFTDHDPELGARVTAGRRREFREFRAFSDPAARERIPDPQARETFEHSRPLWEERAVGDHAAMLALHRELLAFRRDDPVMRATRAARPEAKAAGGVLVVRRAHGGAQRILLANFSEAAVRLETLPVPPDARRVIATAPAASGAELPGWSAAILAAEASA